MINDVDTTVNTLKNRVRRLESKSRRGLVGGVSGAVLGAGAGHYFLSGEVREMANAAEEGFHALKVVSKLGRFGQGSEATFSKYLSEVSPAVRQAYDDNVANESLLLDGSREAIESLQRSSLAFPGQETIPVQGIKGLKGKIIEKTKTLMGGDKEEVHQTNTSQYQGNYNHLVTLRISAIDRRELSRSEARSLASKLEESALNTGRIDQEGLRTFEGIVTDFNNASSVLRDIKGLSVGEVYQGEGSGNYASVLQEARNYNIKPFVPGAFADASVYALWALGAYAGFKAGRTVGRAASSIYETGRGAVKLAGRATNGLVKLAKKIGTKKNK